MSMNLNVSTFRNGDIIPEVKTFEDWQKASENKQPAWCYYNNDSTNGAKYGKLYNWYAVNDPRNLAPLGYHIPSDAEWKVLTDYLGGIEVTGKKMKSKVGWESYEGRNGNGNNKSGFLGFAGGWRFIYGGFNFIGINGYWWTSTEVDNDVVWTRNLSNNVESVPREYFAKAFGLSVRCLKD
jgi:uncharacterized protein (TIGR02145 family)